MVCLLFVGVCLGFLWGFVCFVLFVFVFGFFNTNCSPSPQYIITEVSFSIHVYCWVDHFELEYLNCIKVSLLRFLQAFMFIRNMKSKILSW